MTSLPHALSEPALVLEDHDVLCCWIPGTTQVHVSICGRYSGQRNLEADSGLLRRVFGQAALNDLYLKGRARLRADDQQIAQLDRLRKMGSLPAEWWT